MEFEGGDVVHHGGQEERQAVEVGTSGAHITCGELVSIRDEAEGKSAGEDMVAVKRERVEQLVEEEEAEEAEADAKKQKEKVLEKRRAIPNEEAERGRPLQRMQPPRCQPLQTLMESEDEHRVEGEKIPTPPTAPDSTTMEPTTTCRPGRLRKSYPTSSLPQPPNACSTCMSFGITCEPVPGYVCKPCQMCRKGCEHSSRKRA